MLRLFLADGAQSAFFAAEMQPPVSFLCFSAEAP
jgi:hypothetical protein